MYLLVLVLVEDGRRVHDELTVPHSLSNLFLNVFTVSAILNPRELLE